MAKSSALSVRTLVLNCETSHLGAFTTRELFFLLWKLEIGNSTTTWSFALGIKWVKLYAILEWFVCGGGKHNIFTMALKQKKEAMRAEKKSS